MTYSLARARARGLFTPALLSFLALAAPVAASAHAGAPVATMPAAKPAAASSGPLAIYAGAPLAGYRLTIADDESSTVLAGDSASVAPPAATPTRQVRATRSGKELALQWKDAWYAALRVDGGAPRDLRPYLARGVLSLEVRVDELSNGGLAFKVGCGEQCERAVSYVVPARAAQGKGWQKLSYAMRCFVRDGADFSAVRQPFALEATGAGKVAIANVRILAQGRPNMTCPDYRTASVTPDKLNESWSVGWWTGRHEQKLKEAAALGKKAQVVFIGDSITQGWEKDGAPVWQRYYQPLDALALGFGGDRTENVLWRLQHGEVDGLSPKVAVLMFGTNNTGHRKENPATTAAGIKRNIDELRQRLPDTRILLLAIFPRGATPDDPGRRLNDQVNAIIAGYADNRHVFYRDIGPAFLAPDGTLSTDIMPDLLHPNRKGYEIWAREMAPMLDQLLGRQADASGSASTGTGVSANANASASVAAPYAWRPIAIGGSGFISGIVPSKTQKDLVYLRTDVGGAYRRDRANGRWVALLDWVSDRETGMLGVESIATDPSSPNKLYLSTGIAYLNGGASTILKSDDYGNTFRKIDVTGQFKVHGNGMGRGNGEKLQVDPANGSILYIGTRANGLFKSVDEGLSWQHLPGLDVGATPPNNNGVSFVLLDPASKRPGANGKAETGRLFVGVSRYGKNGPNMFVSDDAGRTFTPMAGGPAHLMPHRAVLAAGGLVVTFARGAGPWGDVANGEGLEAGGVWRYDIAARTWRDISPPLNRAYAGITVDPGNAQHMIVTTINYYRYSKGRMGDQFYETLDGGKSWRSIVDQGVKIDPNGVSWIAGSFMHWAASIEFDPFDARKLMVVSGNGLFVSSDVHAAPAIWKFDDDGIEESVPLNLVSIPGGPLISAIGDYDGFRHTDVTQYAPIHTPTMGTTWGLDFAAQQPSVVARAGSAIYLSRDMGVSWNKAATMHGTKGQLALGSDGATIIHSPEHSQRSFVSRDGGDSWTAVPGLDGARPVADPRDARRFYAVRERSFLVSRDGGATFASAATLTAAPPGDAMARAVIRAVPGRSGDVWVPLYDGGLARTVDGGATFAGVPGVRYAAAVGFGKAAPGADFPTVYLWGAVDGAGDGRGMFRSTDGGASWLRINDDRHQYGGPGDAQFVVGDANTFGVVYMSTAGRGIVAGRPAASTMTGD
ncbi:hypothetical protein ASF61_20085 [Duganella sp. Leaf126]|uniref:GDSL-type esterase/lipase family protein n=1 Tax=Duganella sp. Leaf126 TaxID=1736266 RepID=UPI0006FF8564|nr:GDSL-type esterase/lipase family protein [Duganella sp. Leaf126]KQQ45269.1 hypothetical protein ASF61_20085 [Duganella sp. Leaf126]